MANFTSAEDLLDVLNKTNAPILLSHVQAKFYQIYGYNPSWPKKLRTLLQNDWSAYFLVYGQGNNMTVEP